MPTIANPDGIRALSEPPLVTVGMATHDAERLVRASLRSILSLDYPNLQILINDNGSSDKTLDIVRAEAQGDSRVTVTAWPDDRGAAANFNLLAGRAEGEYFFWASDHDAWHATFVRRLVDALESDSGAVLAYPQTMLVDFDGQEKGPYGRLMWTSLPMTQSPDTARWCGV